MAAPRLLIPSGRWRPVALSPPCRVSQVPRLIFPCALSPTTPEGPAGACSLLPCRWQASSSLADWPPPLASRGRIGFACATARRFASPVSTRWITPSRSGSATRTNEQFTWWTPMMFCLLQICRAARGRPTGGRTEPQV